MDDNFVLTWENISVEIVEKSQKLWNATTKKKRILGSVTGITTSNSLIAIMGPSGSGKTTLLGAISGRLKNRSGVVKINGKIVDSNTIRKCSGYCRQDNIFVETLTVYEHLKFLAAMKLGFQNKIERHQIIETLMSKLSLIKHKNKRIKLLSGGELRRVSLASELLSNPQILFCDEPTTGLDSFTAMTIVQELDNIAKLGKIVFVTIHQPSTQLFNCFSNIMLLSSGRLIFQGRREEMKSFFESEHLVLPESYNPAEFYIKCITDEAANGSKIQNLSEISRNRAMQELQNSETRFNEDAATQFSSSERKHYMDFFPKLMWLVWRNYINEVRNYSIQLAALSLRLFSTIIISCCYLTVTLVDSGSVQNIQGILFFVLSELIFSHMYGVLYIFNTDLRIFIAENGLYSCFAYLIAKMFILIPIAIIGTMGFLAVNFLTLSFLNSLYLYMNMVIVASITSIAASALGLSFSALFTSQFYMELVIPSFDLLIMLLSGMWIKVGTAFKIFEWLRYISPFYLSYESFSILQWGNVTHLDKCTNLTEATCYTDGPEVLEYYGFGQDQSQVFYNNIYMCLLIIVYCFVGTIGLMHKRSTRDSY